VHTCEHLNDLPAPAGQYVKLSLCRSRRRHEAVVLLASDFQLREKQMPSPRLVLVFERIAVTPLPASPASRIHCFSDFKASVFSGRWRQLKLSKTGYCRRKKIRLI
jgi:hypothetical protein